MNVLGDLSISLTDSKNHDVQFKSEDNQDGTFTISYTPKIPGLHYISVAFIDVEIPISPIKVDVEPVIDVAKIRIEGLENSKFSAHTYSSRFMNLMNFFFTNVKQNIV